MTGALLEGMGQTEVLAGIVITVGIQTSRIRRNGQTKLTDLKGGGTLDGGTPTGNINDSTIRRQRLILVNQLNGPNAIRPLQWCLQCDHGQIVVQLVIVWMYDIGGNVHNLSTGILIRAADTSRNATAVDSVEESRGLAIIQLDVCVTLRLLTLCHPDKGNGRR